MTGDAAGGHLYSCPAEPNEGLVIVHPRTPNRSAPGIIWCWGHGHWEAIPEAWYERERTLREEINTEWINLRRVQGSLGYQSPSLTGWIVAYCENRGWRRPDFNDRYAMFRFIRNLEDERPQGRE